MTTDPADLWNALQTGDPGCVARALDRAVAPAVRQARELGGEFRQAGWGKGANPYEADSAEGRAWAAGWTAIDALARTDPRRDMWAAQQQDLAEHRDLHDGNVTGGERPTEGSKL